MAPVVNGALDQVITLPSSANLTGVAIDDGQPIRRRADDGVERGERPGTVSFSNAGALNSTATFSASAPTCCG